LHLKVSLKDKIMQTCNAVSHT